MRYRIVLLSVFLTVLASVSYSQIGQPGIRFINSTNTFLGLGKGGIGMMGRQPSSGSGVPANALLHDATGAPLLHDATGATLLNDNP